jgi:crotonobetainyl-CoA:carnitine CoA-transferase CaiB-like acyl-CoA transferase
MADIGAGMYTLTAVLAALLARATSGRGTALSVSLFDAVAEWMGYPVNFTLGSGEEQVPNGVSSPAVSPYGAFPTSDGQTVVLGTTNDGEWQRLARIVLDRADLADDPAFAANYDRVLRRAELDPAIEAWTRTVTLAEAQRVLDAASLGNARLNGVQDVIDHPQLAKRDRWRDVATPAGPWPMLLPPPVSPDWEPRMDPVPALGEHTDAVLAELGYSADDVVELRAAGVL